MIVPKGRTHDLPILRSFHTLHAGNLKHPGQGILPSNLYASQKKIIIITTKYIFVSAISEQVIFSQSTKPRFIAYSTLLPFDLKRFTLVFVYTIAKKHQSDMKAKRHSWHPLSVCS
jgi:hypothetical protein